MQIPYFRCPGGKAKIVPWLMQYFPKYGETYIELFAGRGNAFFGATQSVHFKKWVLRDREAKFLKALQSADLHELPVSVTREQIENGEFEQSIVDLIEPYVTFAGVGYPFYALRDYARTTYAPKCEAGQLLLQGVTVESAHWESFDLQSLSMNDFCFLDPPYYQTVCRGYPNIDHFALVKALNLATNTRWCLAGYENDLYDRNLVFKRKATFDRPSVMKSGRRRDDHRVIETLWMNY